MNPTPSTPETTSAPASRSTLIRAIPLVVIGLFCICIAAGLAFAAERQSRFDGRIYPGVSVSGVDLGGLRPDDARIRLDQALNQTYQNGLSFQLGTSTISATPAQLRKWVQYDKEASLQAAATLGRHHEPMRALLSVLGLTLHHRDLPLTTTVNQDSLRTWLTSSTAALLPAPQNARLVIDLPTASSSEVRIEPEISGQTADLEPVLEEVSRQAEVQTFRPIQISVQPLEPAIRVADLEPLKTQAAVWLTRAPFTLTLEKRTLNVAASTLAGWITATNTTTLGVTIDRDRLQHDLAPWLGDSIRPAKNGELVLDENKALKSFVAPVEGVRLDADATSVNIERVLNTVSSTAQIILRKEEPQILGTDAAEMGIREVIGVGRSEFSGSPSNRRRNIALGAQHVNGSLIAPDGEFSLLKTLGPIDGSHGWLPELVIKGNKTTPEYGGGLCQIGTTVFRAAMNSGLVITERRNHSYRVRYYEPAGTDATIYDPAPDFRFKNDTGHWVLITTEVRGDNLVFSVWGTKDGRSVAPLNPVISNIVAPPPKKLIPTTELPPGQQKCTEVAHAGATAKLDYVVTYAGGEVKKTTFTSYYKPWGAVCLVGSTTATPAEGGVDETGVNNPN